MDPTRLEINVEKTIQCHGDGDEGDQASGIDSSS